MTRIPKTLAIKNAFVASTPTSAGTGTDGGPVAPSVQTGPLFLTTLVGVDMPINGAFNLLEISPLDYPHLWVALNFNILESLSGIQSIRSAPYIRTGTATSARVRIEIFTFTQIGFATDIVDPATRIVSAEQTVGPGFDGFIPITWTLPTTGLPQAPYWITVSVQNQATEEQAVELGDATSVWVNTGVQTEFWNANNAIVPIPTPPPTGGGGSGGGGTGGEIVPNELPDVLDGLFGTPRTLMHDYPGMPQFWGSQHMGDEVSRFNPANVTDHGGGKYTLTATVDSSAPQGYYSGAVSFGFIDNTTDAPVQVGDFIQATIKFPGGQGVWGAFWMFRDYGGGGLNETYEIDVVEVLGSMPGSSEHHTHFFADVGLQYSIDWTQWTTWGVHITDTTVDYYVNGEFIFSMDGSDYAGTQWGVIANLAIGGSWGGNPDGTSVFPMQMEVDSIKVWSP